MGSLSTPAIFILSCQVPVVVAPSPQFAKVTIPELSCFDAKAQPTATGAASGWVPNANTNRIMYTPFANANTFTTSVPVGVST